MQDRLVPEGMCFGCGPANEDGLQLKSHLLDDGSVVATITPESKHQAAPGVLCGGIIGTLLDCHGMMAAVAALDATADEGMTTKEFTVRMKGVTPIAPLTLRAHAVEHDHRRAVGAAPAHPSQRSWRAAPVSRRGVRRTGRLASESGRSGGESSGITPS